MLYEIDPVSKWVVFHKGFKVVESCFSCRSHNIVYHKVHTKTHTGFAPTCLSCHRKLAIRLRPKNLNSLQRNPIQESLSH